MKLLHLDSSALGEYSATREIGQAVVQELKTWSSRSNIS